MNSEGPTRAYSYIRMSTEPQMLGDSRRRQLELSEVFARDRGLEIVSDFRLEDLGVSAFKGANIATGALGRFLQAARDGEIPSGSFLLVESLDRLSRQEVMTSLAIFSEILQLGISIATLGDRRVYEAGKTELTDLIYSLVVMSRAHEESQIKSQRVAAAWSQKRINGTKLKLTAICPAWLRLEDDRNEFCQIPERVAMVREIFSDSAGGIGSFAIAKRLNERGVPPFGRSAGWQPSSVKKILSNRAVLGEFQPHQMIGGRRIAAGNPIPDYFPRVLDDDAFYRARNAAAERRVGSSGRKGQFVSNLFSGLAKCAYCKSGMHFVNKGTGSKGGTYLVCDKGRRSTGCVSTGWRYPDFETSVLALVKEIDLEPIVRAAERHETRTKLGRAVQAIRGNLGELEFRRTRTYALISDGNVSIEFLGTKLRDVEAEIVQAQQELAEISSELSGLEAAAIELYENQEDLQALIDELQDRSGKDNYKLRSKIAARLKEIVLTMRVAPEGNAPSVRATVSMIRNEIAELDQDLEPISMTENVIDELEAQLLDDRQNRRYFSIGFKDGDVRIVFPSSANPLESVEQVVREDRYIDRYDRDNSATRLHNPAIEFDPSDLVP